MKVIWSSILVCVLMSLPSPVALAKSASPCTSRALLNEYERSEFISAAFGEKPIVNVHVMAEEGCNNAMLEALSKVGATVRFSDAQLGYALLAVRKDKVLSILDLPGIAYAFTTTDIYYDHSLSSATDKAYVPLSERRVEPTSQITLPVSRVGRTLPKDGPYFAADEAGLTELWKQHPEADGRGVKVAVVDSGFDLLHPEVEEAGDADGKSVAKVADVLTLASRRRQRLGSIWGADPD
jgi:hypothetical protein